MLMTVVTVAKMYRAGDRAQNHARLSTSLRRRRANHASNS